MAQIIMKDIHKSFGTTKVIEGLNLTIPDGSFTVLVGPSGCGKTTLLRMIAGIGPATSGQIYLDNTEITDVPPGKRNIAMVFQNYAIYPTMSVRGNIEYGLKNNKVPKAERNRLIAEVAEAVGLTEYLNRSPGTLSGGQRQRVALARAMVKNPRVFLMDEPLSNLDAKLRVAMRGELIELHNRLKTTFVYVTHDQVEAMSMADNIVLMNKGVIQQQAKPSEIYRDPNNVFTAQFIGTPPMNVLPMPSGCYIGFRPEKTLLSAKPLPGAFHLKGQVITREMLGAETLYKVHCGEHDVMIRSTEECFDFGQSVDVSVQAEDLYFFDSQQMRIRQKDVDAQRWNSLLEEAGRYGA